MAWPCWYGSDCPGGGDGSGQHLTLISTLLSPQINLAIKNMLSFDPKSLQKVLDRAQRVYESNRERYEHLLQMKEELRRHARAILMPPVPPLPHGQAGNTAPDRAMTRV